MIEREDNYGGSICLMGQAAWAQLIDGNVFVVTGEQCPRPDGDRSSQLRGCTIREDDFGEELTGRGRVRRHWTCRHLLSRGRLLRLRKRFPQVQTLRPLGVHQMCGSHLAA